MDRVLRYLTKIPPGAVVAVIAVAALWQMSNSPTAARRVPELEGLPVNSAIAKAAKAGYFTKVVFERSGGIAGTVVRQSPDELTVHEKRSTIVLRVTRGVPQVKVPDVRGIDVEEARRRLDRSHLVPGAVTYKKDQRRAPDQVIATSPGPGKLVDVGTTVDILAAA